VTAPILYYKKDAGTNDTFRFKIDGDTKLSVSSMSMSWQQWSSPVTGAGSHTIQWKYSKGGSGTTADGGVWVDKVEWDPDDSSSSTLAESLDCRGREITKFFGGILDGVGRRGYISLFCLCGGC
jgi:hypothetical protein